MERKTLHMIGNSHIDPVWFWTREEGMQEVKATFASVLDRMEEYPDFHFTATSAAFFVFLEEAAPEMLQKIRERVREGRLEITGGWWVEPDCNLPCGESLVRQGLYGQRFFEKAFGMTARIASNVDSFGHAPMLPQILRGCGMDKYVFMRPSLTRSQGRYMQDPAPLVAWTAPDGSQVTALSLPAEYTCWFLEPTRENIRLTLEQLSPYPSLPCFFGVGNHGGGPTIANIEAIRALRAEFPDVDLRFSTLAAFFEEVQEVKPPVLTTYLERVNSGCYSVDHRYKQQMRAAEQALLRAERLLSMASLAGDGLSLRFEAFESLWRRLLFCQFHDTLGGTAIREARDNALHDIAGVTAQAEEIAQMAVQRLLGRFHTQGEGTPLVLINDTPAPFEGVIDAELNWFCNDPLALFDEAGREIPYQRAKQSCTMMWYRLGGRRRVLFPLSLPAFGIRVLRARAQKPVDDPTPSHERTELRMENSRILAEWDGEGNLFRLTDKETGCQVLSGGSSLRVFVDERDTWGHAGSGRRYGEFLEEGRTEEAVITERGPVRQALRVRKRLNAGRAEFLYTLDEGEDFLRLEVRLVWDGPWKELRLRLPLAFDVKSTLSEAPYGAMVRTAPGGEYFMHRFVDARDSLGRGLTVANNGIYGFSQGKDALDLILLRSPIYAQGTCVGWKNDHDTYEYTDLGDHRFTFLLRPHGTPAPAWDMAALADRLSSPPVCVLDSFHPGALSGGQSFLSIGSHQVRLGALKKWEDGDGLIFRLHETEGQAVTTSLRANEKSWEVSFRPFEIKTLLARDRELLPMDMLEKNVYGK